MQTVAVVAVCRCLVPRPHYSARSMCFGSRGPGASRDTPQNALTEKAWEDSTVVVTEKQGIVID